MRVPTSVQVIVGLLAAVLSVTQLWDWFVKPSQQLEADIQFGPFGLPPALDAYFDKLQPVIAGDWIEPLVRSSIGRAVPAQKDADRIARDVAREVQFRLRDSVPTRIPIEVTTLTGYWRATVRNTGSQPLQGVRLVLPHSTFVQVERDGGPAVRRNVDAVIDLDVVHPRDVLRVTAWSKIEPGIATEGDVRLTHAGGVGTLTIHRPVGILGRLTDQYAFPAVMLLMLGACITGLVLSARPTVKTKPALDPSSEGATSGRGKPRS